MGRQTLTRLSAAAAGLLLLAVWAVCFLRVNRAYPQAELIRAGINEPLRYGPYLVTVSGARIEDAAVLYEESGLSAGRQALPEKILVCTVAVERSGLAAADPAQADLSLSRIAAVSGAWSGMADTGELYAALNQEAGPLDGLQQGERQTYLLPFSLWRASFSRAGWDRLGERDFTLQLSIYPKKCEILFHGMGL